MASKVYFNLGAYEDSLNFALAAGEMFDVSERSEYVQMMITKCIDQYSKQRQQGNLPDKRLENMVNRMFHKVLTLKLLFNASALVIALTNIESVAQFSYQRCI